VVIKCPLKSTKPIDHIYINICVCVIVTKGINLLHLFLLFKSKILLTRPHVMQTFVTAEVELHAFLTSELY